MDCTQALCYHSSRIRGNQCLDECLAVARVISLKWREEPNPHNVSSPALDLCFGNSIAGQLRILTSYNRHLITWLHLQAACWGWECCYTRRQLSLAMQSKVRQRVLELWLKSFTCAALIENSTKCFPLEFSLFFACNSRCWKERSNACFVCFNTTNYA